MLCLLALPLVAPALGQSASAQLLLCCRKNGAHHCNTPVPTDAPMLVAHCGACQSVASQASGRDGAAVSFPQHSIRYTALAFRTRQVQAGYRISFLRSRQKRGPPASLLA